MDKINIQVNGEKMTVAKDMCLDTLINDLKIQDKIMAAAINTNVVKKDDYKSTTLKEGDELEFLAFVGGG